MNSLIKAILLVLIINSISSCKSQQATLASDYFGEYEINWDSISNPNTNFYEHIELSSDGSFIYRMRMGGFIKTEVNGNWELKKQYLVLNSNNATPDTIDLKECDSKNEISDSIYVIKVRNKKGYKINYSLILNGDRENIIKEQFDQTVISRKIPVNDVQIITSSGIYSNRLSISKKGRCFLVAINDKRVFVDEEWMLLNNKIRPMGLDKNPVKYFLYKK